MIKNNNINDNDEINLYKMETELHEDGVLLICGIDEAGRGPLAGVVVAAAVILPEGLIIEGLNDSKKLSEKKREKLYPIIMEKAICSVGIADVLEIEEINILKATLLAMRRAVEGLSITPDYALVDGNVDPQLLIPTQTVVKGDSKSACIAAASVIAKVTRDRMMIELDKEHPEYGFAKHKGYGTPQHYAAIEEHGFLPCHRKSFFKKKKKA